MFERRGVAPIRVVAVPLKDGLVHLVRFNEVDDAAEAGVTRVAENEGDVRRRSL